MRIRRDRAGGADQVDAVEIHQPVRGNVEKLIGRSGCQYGLVAAESRCKARVLHPIVECAKGRGAGGEVWRRISVHPGERRVRHSIPATYDEPVTLAIQTK